MVKTGLDLINNNFPKKLRGSRIGLVIHPASVNRHLSHAYEVFLTNKKFHITALFGPQHGIRGETQDNMIEWEGFKDTKTGLPIYSLYGQMRKPSSEMLKDVDCIVIDLQDVGARYYTFIWTMDLIMEACDESNKSLIILDRPNPISCLHTEGAVLDSKFSSFVGLKPLSIRHGMTIGEIALYLKDNYHKSLDLQLKKMNGYKRSMWFDQTGLPWVMPSPNMPTLDTATVYPGQCLLEGTTLSEGRGTTRPFEIFGAPFVDTDKLIKRLSDFRLGGCIFRPLHFMPTFQKHRGKLCGGAQIHITNRDLFKPFQTTVAIIKAIIDLYPNEKIWRDPPYEYELEKLPFDIIAGTDRLRLDIESGKSLKEIISWCDEQLTQFNKFFRDKYIIYD
ncbi:MAG: DUF1343 domain-containing protein [Thermodesulfovibrionales bacterium]|nr:DUF1343 domain-containing protein [Thermodesulfovibrionales bacterium]